MREIDILILSNKRDDAILVARDHMKLTASQAVKLVRERSYYWSERVSLLSAHEELRLLPTLSLTIVAILIVISVGIFIGSRFVTADMLGVAALGVFVGGVKVAYAILAAKQSAKIQQRLVGVLSEPDGDIDAYMVRFDRSLVRAGRIRKVIMVVILLGLCALLTAVALGAFPRGSEMGAAQRVDAHIGSA